MAAEGRLWRFQAVSNLNKTKVIVMSQARIERWIEKNGYVWNCCIISGHYGKQLSAYDELFDEARKDFPLLNRNDVECLQAGGSRVSGCSMLRFQIPAWSIVPAGWLAKEGTVEELRQ